MSEFQPLAITHDGLRLTGLVARPAGHGPFPTVLVMHSAMGIAHQVPATISRLAALGYLAVGSDMYGAGSDTLDETAVGTEFTALTRDPPKLRSRVIAWFEATAALADADAARIAAIGYCFGGMCVLELARSGADVKAVASYHGLLTTHAPAEAGTVKGHVAAFCGGRDPYAPMEDITALRNELEAAGATYSMHVFGDAEHAFTDVNAASHKRPGISYNAAADKLSWAGTLALLEATLV